MIALGMILWAIPRPAAAAAQVFTATLTGAQQVPPVASGGTGTGTVMLNAAENQIIVNLTFSGLTTPAIMAHIHGPGAAGANAAVLFNFEAVVPAATSGTIPAQTFAITPAQVAELRAGLYYFNVHSNNFPGGEIRGQIGLAAVQATTTLTGAQQVPAVASPGTGTGIVALNAAEDQLIVNMSFSGLTTPASMAHIHGPGAAGVNAAVLFDFAAVVPNATAGSIPQQIFPITPAQVAELKAGLYYFNIHTSNFPNGEIRGQITFPNMSVDHTSLRFAAVSTGAAFTSQTSAQTVRLLQSGAGTVTWTAQSNQPWLTVTPASGTGSATLTVGVQFANGVPINGEVSGMINLVFTGGGTVPAPIDVNLTLLPQGTTGAPFGIIDTPLNNADGVTGAIPFTGWSLDDIEVSTVAICRAGVTGEPVPFDTRCGSTAKIFVGNAVFIDGARPDVQGAFPSFPRSTRAGWGFMVLTNMLPAQGNGTYTFFAYLTDRDEHIVLLDTRTITCSNATSVKPFGTIDTPGQGETISGTAYVNFGWALTPQVKTIPVDGSTLTVVIDGFPVGNVDYNHFRADIASLFPGLNNTDGAVGFRMIDTTTLGNGLHTIAWSATDDDGAADGLGSRYFIVANGAGLLTGAMTGVDDSTPGESATLSAAAPLMMPAGAGAALSGSGRGDAAVVLRDEVDAARLDSGPIVVSRGWNFEAPGRQLRANASGLTTVQSEELDRMELRLASGRHQYSGYLRAGGALAPLPIGSRLDVSSGVFTWQPGVGFIGAYDFVFVRWAGGRALARQEVRVVLNPKGSGRVGPQVMIDLPSPAAAASIAQPFVVAGWAADLDAASGPGVDALHVWAYPVDGRAPIFVGATTTGGRRPDVGAVFGDQFRDSGYGLVVDALAPGTYDLAVFAWSAVHHGFVPAKVVRVTVR